MLKISRVKIVILITSCLLFFELQGQRFLKVNGRIIVNGEDEKVTLRGVGLGGWVLHDQFVTGLKPDEKHSLRKQYEEIIGSEKTDRIYDAWVANFVREIDISTAAVWGFNAVRLPLDPDFFILTDEQETNPEKITWNEKRFLFIDNILRWCTEHNLYLVPALNIAEDDHTSDEQHTSRLWGSASYQQKVISFWKKLSERYASEEWIGAYDILGIINQPMQEEGNGQCQNSVLKDLSAKVTAAIREVDGNHIIIISTLCDNKDYQHIFASDKSLVLGFLKDCNHNDETSIQELLDIRDRYNIPLWLREPTENSNLWFRDAIRLLEKNEIGWSWCPLKAASVHAPLEVKINPGYQKIMDYWEGKAEKPSEKEAYAALMKLNSDLKLENCIFHKDIIDAMFRQVYSSETRPFRNRSLHADFTVNAVDYDLGGNGRAYYDNDTANYYVASGQQVAWNQGKAYRNDGVDIKTHKTTNDHEYYVSHFDTGEWLRYTLFIREEGLYNIDFMVASNHNEGQLGVEINGRNTKKQVPKTGGEEQWDVVSIKKVLLNAGSNVIRVKAQKGGFNFKAMVFTKVNKKPVLLANYPVTAEKQRP